MMTAVPDKLQAGDHSKARLLHTNLPSPGPPILSSVLKLLESASFGTSDNLQLLAIAVLNDHQQECIGE